MTNTLLTLEGVSCVLPDGRALFSNLHYSFDLRHTGLVGRNGVGKTMLARMLAGEIAPSSGRCVRHRRVHYLAQQVTPADGATVADLVGLRPALDALLRIEAGSVAPEDFERLADRWDIRQRLQAELERAGLGHLRADAPARQLSGGEVMRAALAGAMLSDAELLLLDEPSNHLDRPHRLALIEQLRRWPRGLIVISHDRELLEAMDCIVELSAQGLRSYGGAYSFYAERKTDEQATALQLLDQRKQERQREQRALREQHDQLQRRQAQGRQRGREANQAKILLGRQKERSEASAGQALRRREALRERLDEGVRDAARQLADETRITLHMAPARAAAGRRVALLEEVVLPLLPASAATRTVDLALHGQQRVGVIGPNGCGKSTLLKVLSGAQAPLAGRCIVSVPAAYLDQHVTGLSLRLTVIDQALETDPAAGESAWRMKLAQLGLDAHRLALPSGQLSGGERLKAALALALYANPPAQLLLLDEPSNHLDLPSLEALETLLRGYTGALLVVSHDEAFLRRLELTDRLEAMETGWRLSPF
ncbi:ABC transporter ATP-binding protein [Hylemonella gracilis str. Niagara R]|uniref:ABC transporter ATP-binding protein n=1 Tax=Hylemonella gracilis str. Niagara R TaxID=1458275 RepID=A0A016XK53_9BURK|nr:ATP-binding cassette domain-containing protein [Hylemonella gracilis]EYC51942.1 ABC transporter ATP-binding protein [Hylemonella gracilis str. Niagara R]